MIRLRRGVSEIFSALLVVMITLAVGLTVYFVIIDYLNNQESATANQLMKAEYSATRDLVIVRAYINGSDGDLWIIVSTSSGGATIYDVYVDNILAEPKGFQLPLHLGPNELVKVGPFSSPTTSPGNHKITIITEYGTETGYAEVIG